jgi:hypothetical protein
MLFKYCSDYGLPFNGCRCCHMQTSCSGRVQALQPSSVAPKHSSQRLVHGLQLDEAVKQVRGRLI